MRFREPPHDICIKNADPIELKAFTGLIKKIVELSSSKAHENDLENLLAKNNSTLSALNPASKKQVSLYELEYVLRLHPRITIYFILDYKRKNSINYSQQKRLSNHNLVSFHPRRVTGNWN